MWSPIKQSLKEDRSITDQSQWIKRELIGDEFELRPVALPMLYSAVASQSSSSAFWLGYQTAVQQLFGAYLKGQLAAFVVNEQRSSNPKHWKTQLMGIEGQTNWRLSGQKDFVTAPDQIDCMLVGCLTEEFKNDRRVSKICCVKRAGSGLTLVDKGQSFPVLRDLKKASVAFEQTEVPNEALLPADGYDYYVKPFRMVEDFYLSVSLLGFVVRLVLEQSLQTVVPINRISILLSSASTCEQSLLKLFPGFSQISLEVESYIEQSAVLITEIVETVSKREGSDSVWMTLNSDIMLFKLGERARAIRNDRALTSL